MTKLNTRGLDAELSRAAAYYATIEELEAGIERAQAILAAWYGTVEEAAATLERARALLEDLTPEQTRRARSESVLANLQRIRAHHYDEANDWAARLGIK